MEVVKIRLMGANSLLELLDVLGTALSKGGLCLPIALLPFFGSRVDLWPDGQSVDDSLAARGRNMASRSATSIGMKGHGSEREKQKSRVKQQKTR